MLAGTWRASGLAAAVWVVAAGEMMAAPVGWAGDRSEGETVQPGATAPSATDEEKDKKVERIVVTGSRLKKDEFSSSAPIQIIDREETTLEGVRDTADVLQGSSVAAVGRQINNTFAGFVTDGGPGANTVSLRGLDPKRTLILINGRRLAPAGSRGSIGAPDLNTIPGAMIERYEILKDGGSAIYGSDAVAGVINAITRQGFEGASIETYASASFEGGAETSQINGIWGDTFERGQIMIAGEYDRREPLRFGDRDYLGCPQDNVRNAATGALLDLIDPATGVAKCFSIVDGVVDLLAGPGGRYVPAPGLTAGGGFLATTIPATAGAQPNRANLIRVGHSFTATNTYINNYCVTFPLTPFCATPTMRVAEAETRWRASQVSVPTDDPRLQAATVISPATRYSVVMQGDFDLAAGVEGFTELQFTRRESVQEFWRQFFPSVASTNLSNPHGLTARAISLIPLNTEQTVDFYRGVIGVRGEFAGAFPVFAGWSYNFYLQHQRSEADYTSDVIFNDRVLAATAGGGVFCNQSLITVSGGDCASIPAGIRWFDADVVANGTFSATESAFLFARETGHTVFEQTLINGVVTGDLAALPAGPLGVALGFEMRKDEIDDTPGFNTLNNNNWGQGSAGRTTGSDTVREVFGEVAVPLLKGAPFADELNLDASLRYTNYDRYGDGATYKLGLNWRISPQYRLRGTTGTSFRAPALFELYLANEPSGLPQASIDPCGFWDTSANPQIIASCGPSGLNLPPGYSPSGSALILRGGGGPGLLAAETSESRTIGFIWTPDWIDFSAAVDYWELEVNNEVDQFGPANILAACHTTLPFPSSPYCSLFDRDTNPLSPTFGRINTVNDSFVNISSEVTDGLDLTVRYEHEFSFGALRLGGDFSWVFTRELRVFPDPTGTVSADDLNGGVYFPDFVGNLDVRFDHRNWTFFWGVDMSGRQSDAETFGGSVFDWRGFTPVAGKSKYKNFGEFYASHDASVRYAMDDWTFQIGVQNIFDEPPPSVSVGGVGALGGRIGNSIARGNPVYDLVGRRGFIAITREF